MYCYQYFNITLTYNYVIRSFCFKEYHFRDGIFGYFVSMLSVYLHRDRYAAEGNMLLMLNVSKLMIASRAGTCR